MENELKNKSIDLEKIDKIKKSLSNINDKKSKFLFCVAETQTPVASTYEVYFHADIIKKMGYQVIILTEKKEYIIPTWIETELTDHKHMCIGDAKLTVGPEDVMIIPEVFTNIMEQTKSLPCIRIVLFQSADYMLNSLLPGTDWNTFNINNVITTSETLKEFIQTYFGKNKFNIKTYNIGIPEYFKNDDNPKKPIISIVGRNSNEISKIVKLFFSKYPQYSWVTFDAMLTKTNPVQNMRRIDFANRLRENFAAVWVDRIASFGTFPLECMKSGVLPICLKPDITPEYILNRNEKNEVDSIISDAGIWTSDYYEIPSIIADVIFNYLQDTIPNELYANCNNIVEKYTVEKSKENLTNIYQEFINDRIKLFEKVINN
jgi:hypothetical protein